MAKTEKSSAKALETAQEAQEQQDMSQEEAAQTVPETAQEGAAAQEVIGPEDPAELLGRQDEPTDEAELMDGLLVEYAVTAEGGLRLRERPDGNAPVIATLPWGAGVFADEEPIGEWIPVTTGLLSGYMMAEHLIPLSPALKQMAAGHE